LKEISLHILDLIENSINADSKVVKLYVIEDIRKDIFKVIIEDDGKGMDEEFLKQVENPFVTTRTTRKVGLGISLVKANAIMCDGNFKIDSKKDIGTKLEVEFRFSHIDRPPLGDMTSTIICIINNDKNVDLYYKHSVNDSEFILDTKEVKEIVGEENIGSIDVIMWIKDYIKENLEKLYNRNL